MKSRVATIPLLVTIAFALTFTGLSSADAAECWQSSLCIPNTINGGSDGKTAPIGGSARPMVAYSLLLR